MSRQVSREFVSVEQGKEWIRVHRRNPRRRSAYFLDSAVGSGLSGRSESQKIERIQ